MRRSRFSTVLGLLLFGVLACCGCKATLSPGEAYISADRATYDALTPILAPHATTRPAVDDAIKSWDARIRAGEKQPS